MARAKLINPPMDHPLHACTPGEASSFQGKKVATVYIALQQIQEPHSACQIGSAAAAQPCITAAIFRHARGGAHRMSGFSSSWPEPCSACRKSTVDSA